MSVHLHAVIRTRPGKLMPMLALLKEELIPIMESGGWKLIGCYTGKTGPINTIIDLWELDDMEHFQRAYAVFTGHENFPSIRERLDQYVIEETLTFCDKR